MGINQNNKIMDELTRDAIVSIGAFAGIFGIVYVYFITRHRERMSMLEKGVTASPFNSLKHANSMTLKYGMLLIGIAIGTLMGHVFAYQLGLAKSTAFLAMWLLFGGLSLVINYMIEKRSEV